MCGIVGFTGMRAGREAILKAMTDAIAHRGPDGEGSYFGSGVALGHRRLSIIDLAGGAQPMFNENKNLAVVFNGEIYNFMELRAQLVEAGHTFSTDHSDTEVLLHGYEEWGEGMLAKLRGMFAFAIWNEAEQTLFCARDHFGIKPFYYYLTDEGELLFGSEIKSFLAHPGFKKELNQSQLELYLSYQYSPGEDTFFKGVKKLLPAHSLLWKAGQVDVKRYWEPRFEPEEGKSLSDWESRVEEVMRQSVAAHKISDVEVGSFLSSGVDSSYMAYLAHVDKTFTVGFANKQYDETDYAAEFSKFMGVKNYAYRIEPEEYWENLPRIQYHMDEPLADAASVALYFVNREAAKQVKVCLSGEGADEFFGGYNIYKEPFTVSWYDHIPLPIRRAIGAVAEQLPPVHGVNFLVRRSRPLEERYIGNTNLMGERRKKQLLKHYTGGKKPTDLSRPYFKKTAGQDPVTRMQYTDLHLWMVGDILLKADKMSMANSLELRVPFLDKEVFEVARHIPVECRADAEHTKMALRGAAARSIPEKTADKKKLGFPVPVRAWLREEKYAAIVREKFQSESAEKFFNTRELTKMLDQHMSEKRDNWRQIWCVFMFLTWYEEYFVKR
ncbi:asparagine synthase (glutamine-hydrolyzing) [Allofournierella massiliensis]|uniref:asparagine synthase (glutamine-hydrolyzing) n=1 Tax=Allofournierella massiliensis TaxID=1650663 RepID=A0A4R1QIX0_9FIRM|nr:asparagine synthase (glutamine-hydrolyzing) [Fournierella massiliensis]TCL53466.1 asparagine synthase (glutamine-hydrolysing) [Fournierella massiliensis]